MPTEILLETSLYNVCIKITNAVLRFYDRLSSDAWINTVYNRVYNRQPLKRRQNKFVQTGTAQYITLRLPLATHVIDPPRKQWMVTWRAVLEKGRFAISDPASYARCRRGS